MGIIKFQKAKPMQAFLKIAVYGAAGSGKTYTSLTQAIGLAEKAGKRVVVFDTEEGTDFLPQRGFDFDAVYTKSLADTFDTIKSLDPKEHACVIVDSVSHLWDSAINSYTGKKTSNESAGGIPMHAWSAIKGPYKALIRLLMECPFHVFILGRQKNVFEDDEFGNMKMVGKAMRAEGETAYEPHICARMEARPSPKDSSKQTYYAIYEKDRTGKLAGRTFANPDFKTIEPLLTMLKGDKQRKAETEDEVSAKDSELNDRADQAKIEKSSDILEACRGLLKEAKDMKSLGDVIEQCKAKKRYLLDKDKNALRTDINDRSAKLSQAA
ncbi:MAG: AAA family ATPase [bacterium]|nr:AAA family ATPase [bacterium]